MPFSRYRPDLMGSASIEPSGNVEAGSLQEIVLTYRAGCFGIDETGSIKIGLRFATDFGPVQFTDPTAVGYTSIEASNGASLDCRWEFKRNIRPWSRSLYIGVADRFLAPGDTLVIRFGDRREGSPGLRMQTYCESAFEFRVFVDAMATYDYVALPMSPVLSVVPGPPSKWVAVLPTSIRAGEAFRLGIRSEDKWGNPSDKADKHVSLTSSRPVEGLPDGVRIALGHYAAIVSDLAILDAGPVEIWVHDEVDGHLLCCSNPLEVVDAAAPLVHFWGDTHGQSNETLGTNSARDYFEFARDKAFLDVTGHQGNDFQITSAFWRDLNRLTLEFDEPGRFVCIPGYEWSGNTALGGDRNVHFRREGELIYRSSSIQLTDVDAPAEDRSEAHTVKDLFRLLEGRDCVAIAHVGGRYADLAFAHDGRIEMAIEVHSAWGTFEWLLHDAFELGHRVGIVANSDGHKGRPGACYPGASFFGSTGGLTCFLAPRLDRDAVFEAMRRRHHYATTGHRPVLSVIAEFSEQVEIFLRDPSLGPCDSVRAYRAVMGDIVRRPAGDLILNVSVVGTAPILQVDIFDGPELVETVRPYDANDLGKRVRLTYRGAEHRGRSRTTIWDGRAIVAGNVILACAAINNWNLDRGIRSQRETEVGWKAVTTGNFGAVDLWLADASQGDLSFETKPVSGSLPISEIGFEPYTIEAGGLQRALEVRRLPDRLDIKRVAFSRTFARSALGDLRLWARITQEDGHVAWTSPIYIVS